MAKGIPCIFFPERELKNYLSVALGILIVEVWQASVGGAATGFDCVICVST